MNTEQRFQSFVTRVRPHRVAILTNSADQHWYHSCLGIMEFLTGLWGGSHCVVIPTDGKTIEEEFWEILSSHDPDIFYQYLPSGADLKHRAPEEFQQLVEAEIQNYATNNSGAGDHVRHEIEKGLNKARLHQWSVSEELNQQILKRIAPFHFGDRPGSETGRRLNIHSITKGSRPRHPLTEVKDVLKSTEKPTQIMQLMVDESIDADISPPKLWFAATVGFGDHEYFEEMSKQQIKPVVTPVTAANLNFMIGAGIRPWQHAVGSFPMGLTGAGLSYMLSTASHHYDLPTVVVVGESLKDFCLYFDLYWQQGRALWLPPWFLPVGEGYPERLMTAIREAEEAGSLEHNESLVLVSYSMPESELERLKDIILPHMYRSSVSVHKINANLVARHVEHPSRAFASGNVGDVTTHLLLNDNLPGWFESPAPRKLHPVSPLSQRWIVDITFLQHPIPRHPALGSIVVHGPNVSDVRTGSGSVSYVCPGFVVVGDNMDVNILRPSIHVPDAEEIFRVILEDCGYKSKTSDKGRYEAETVRKFGGLGNAGYALWSEKHRGLLMKFLDKSESVKGEHDEGVYLKDKRRYLNFAAVSKILGGDLAKDLIDEYVEKAILYRGYVFLCGNCSDAAWYSIADVDQTFTCRRCGLRQQYKSMNWKHPDEPSWFYKLDEMVYLMLENNGHVPLLTLNKLRSESKEEFLFRPEIRLTPKGDTKMYLEVDVCCIANGRLCIGEAKSTDSLAGKNLTPLETAERYRDLAIKIGASVVVFSTTEPTWNQASRDAMRGAFEHRPYIKVMNLTSANLYS